MSQNEVLNPLALLPKINDHYSPRIIGTLNDYEIKLVKLLGEFVWHTHADTDELFIVVSGSLTIQFRDRNVSLNPGELFVVPKGVEHCPKADEEVGVLLLEPKGVLNTSDAETERTRDAKPLQAP